MASNFNDLTVGDGNTVGNLTQFIENNTFVNYPEQKTTQDDDDDDDYYTDLSVDEMKNILKQETDLTLPSLPWLEGGDDLLIRDYFVQLKLLDTRKTISLENIFIQGESKPDVKKIYIEAPPGFGKTTLAHKLVADWVADEKYVSKFDLVFLVTLRYLQEKSVKTMLSKIIKYKDKNKLWELINNAKTLLIFDGLDEIRDEKKSEIINLPFRGTIIITGRTGSFRLNSQTKLKKDFGIARRKEFWERRITINGIDEENRFDFLRRFFGKDNNWEMMMEKIQKLTDSLNEMFESPLMLILLTFVLSENPDVCIRNRTDLFKNLINCLVIRSKMKTDENFDSNFDLFDDVKSSNNEIIELFAMFGSISLNNLEVGNLQFEPNSIIDNIYELGFLIKHETRSKFKTKVHYEGLHLLVIEFAIAFSFWLYYKKNLKFNNDQLILMKDEMEYGIYVFPFLCGLMGEKANELLNEIRPYCDFLCKFDVSDIVFECDKNNLFWKSIVSLVNPYLIIKYEPNSDDLLLIEYAIQFKRIKFIETDLNYLEYLPVNLNEVTLYVNCKVEIYTITDKSMKKLICEKVIFSFKDIYDFNDDLFKYGLEMFNLIDAEIKRIEFFLDRIDLESLFESEFGNTRIDELLCTMNYVHKNEEFNIEQFIAYVTEQCKVKTLELNNRSESPLGNFINSISKSSYLKSVHFYGINSITDFNSCVNFFHKMSLDSFYIEDFRFNFSVNPIKFFTHFGITAILNENEFAIEKCFNSESSFLSNKSCNEDCTLSFDQNCLKSIKMLKSENSGINREWNSIVELKLYYIPGVLPKIVSNCRHIRKITLCFYVIVQMINFVNEYQDLPEKTFSKINLIIETHPIIPCHEELEDKLVTLLIKVQQVKTLVFKIPPDNLANYENRKFCYSLLPNLFTLICSGAIDKIVIVFTNCYDNFGFINILDIDKLDDFYSPPVINNVLRDLSAKMLQCEYEKKDTYSESFLITRKM